MGNVQPTEDLCVLGNLFTNLSVYSSGSSAPQGLLVLKLLNYPTVKLMFVKTLYSGRLKCSIVLG